MIAVLSTHWFVTLGLQVSNSSVLIAQISIAPPTNTGGRTDVRLVLVALMATQPLHTTLVEV